MTREEVYDAWRPESSPWTRWVKPVLFSFMKDDEPLSDALGLGSEWSVSFEPGTALLADLPGPEGVRLGITLARVGYRPVPVYNACPHPAWPWDLVEQHTAVNVVPIMTALIDTAAALNRYHLAANAPPIFLIDSNRKGAGRPDYGWFDNRSFVSVSDFPSGTLLMNHGITNIVVIQSESRTAIDLLQVLLAWQRDGILVGFQEAWQHWAPERKVVRPSSIITKIWFYLTSKLGYPQHSQGAFGGWVRTSSS